jgi:hypothetical protein
VAIGAFLAELGRERNREMQLQIASSFSIKRPNVLNFCRKSGVFPSFGDDIQNEINGPLCYVAILRLFQSLNKTTIYFTVILRGIIGSESMS